MKCPACGRPLAGEAIDCPWCGVVLAKWRRKTGPQPRVRRRKMSAAAMLIALAIPIALLAIAAYLVLRDPPDVLDGSLALQAGALPETDARIALPGSPAGIASNGREIVVANRKDPWGFIRLRPKNDRFVAEPVPLIEPRYSQKMQVNTLTWNGEHYVGITSASWFGPETTDVFTIHDPATLQVIRHVPAPPLIGCVAWDGASYWASTRRNTLDAKEEAYLYRLDREFKVTAKYDPPAVGCQGLMWERSRLWFADVFDDAVYVLDVSGSEPRLMHKAQLNLNYLSGIALHDRAIWLAEYGDHSLHRLKTATRLAWVGAPEPEITAAAMRPTVSVDGDRQPILRARDRNNFAHRHPEGTEDLDWEVELRDGAVWLVSSRIWFGPELFVKRQQQSTMISVPEFARYTYTVKLPDGTEIEKQFEAVAGENVRTNERLADATLHGTYSVSLFIHVQYTDASGTGRILNNSAGFLEVRR